MDRPAASPLVIGSPGSALPADPSLLDPAEVLGSAGVDPGAGLSSAEAARRLARTGPNRLDPAAQVPAWGKLLAQFADPLIYLLLAAIVERQYGYGDVVHISALGFTEGATGTIEEVALRTTRVRTLNGEVVIVPNGEIVQVTNLSRDWARAVVDVPLPAEVDVLRASELLHKAGEEAFEDEELRPLLLDQPTVMGVESFEVGQVNLRMVARTLPGRQFEMGRELRVRIAVAFQREGIVTPRTRPMSRTPVAREGPPVAGDAAARQAADLDPVRADHDVARLDRDLRARDDGHDNQGPTTSAARTTTTPTPAPTTTSPATNERPTTSP